MNLEGHYYTIELAYSGFLAASCALVAFSYWRKRIKRSFMQGLFLAYCIQVVYFTLFNNPLYIALDEQALQSITATFGTHPFLFKNLVPFSSIADQFFWHYWDVSTALNILMTVPLGMLLVRKWQQVNRRVSWRRLVFLGFVFSLMIETTQLIFNVFLGYRYRIVTSDDIIMNMIGTCIGAGIIMIGSWLWQKFQRNQRSRK